MATIKSYTDIEQSKKLAEILPLKSADMCWRNGVSDKYIQCFTPFVIDNDKSNVDFEYDIPCWSLTALLGVVSEEVSLNSFKDGNWNAMVQQNGKMIYSDAGNPIDACYEMIILLNELNLL